MTEADNIVKDFYIGNTHVMISDFHCRNRSEDEIKAILKEISRQVQQAISAAEISGDP